jgi:hypothetical protein
MSKTREEVDALKANWLADPIYELTEVKGFEEHRAELEQFKAEQNNKWMVQAAKEIRSSFEYKKQEVEKELDGMDAFIDDLPFTNLIQANIARQQVRASLLLAEQVKRVGDLLAEKIEEDLASDQTEFMTRLYSIK